MLTASQAAERAARGAASLDLQCPDWAAAIDVERLDVADPCLCVLGQVFSDEGFGNAARMLWPEAMEETGIIAAHGCSLGNKDCAVEDRRAGFALLTEAWRAEIATRTGAVS